MYFNMDRFENREAKNFFQLSNSNEDLSQKNQKHFKKKISTRNKSCGPRTRSQSTGRERKSEFQARYWSFIFGNLQRAIDEIYLTVEYYENLASCQETTLVLENYIREFKALAEWFKVSSDYEKTPLVQRPLAWEVRKTNPLPRIRNKNLSPAVSPSLASPIYSGKNSPCNTIEEIPVELSIKKKSSQTLISKNSSESNEKLNKSLNATVFTSDSREEKFEQLLKEPQMEIQELPPQRNKSLSLENIKEILDNSHFAPGCDFLIQNELQANPDVVARTDNWTQTEGFEEDFLTLLDYLNKHRAPIEDINTIESSIVIREVAVKSKTDSLETKNSAEVLTQSIQSSTKPLLVSTSNKPKQQYSLRNQTIHVLPKRPLSKTTFPQATSSKRNVVRSATDTSKKPVPTAKAVPVQRNLHNRSKTVIEISITNNRHSREDIDSSTSTLKASSETIMNEVESKSRKSEPKSLQSSKVSDEGEWLTVKNKRRSSLHWHQTRFNKPSSTASLPTLALLDESAVIIEKDEPKVKLADNRTKINEKRVKELSEKKVMAKVDSNIKGITEKSPKTAISTSSISKPRHKPSNVTKPRVYTTHSNGKNPLKLAPTDNILSLDHKILRQRSDLTGLKLKSLNKEYLKSERSQNLTQQKKKTETSADLYIDKIDMKTQTSLISNTIDKLYMECFEAEKEQDKIKYRNGDLSSCDELEEKDDFESDDDQKKMLEEQVENLERQIRELENTEIDVDTETDEIIDFEDNESSTETIDPDQSFFINEDITLEMRYAPMLSDMSIAERAGCLATLQDLVARDPGRAQKLHQKLSSPSRRRSFHETLKKYQAKQTRAQEKRQALQYKKTLKIQQLLARVEDVKLAKIQLIENKRLRMELRLKRAAENREKFLHNKVRKAHDEEEKLKEIVFIKNLEAQNKRLDFIESCKVDEVRLQDLEHERLKKAEEKQAKEAAVERRRLELEIQRQQKLEKMNETRREREQRVGKMQEEKEKLRQEIAKEKKREREKRINELQRMHLLSTEELQRKIIQKQQESTRRHEENIEHIRQKALELAQQRNQDDVKANEDEVDVSIAERSKDAIKLGKKKMKKLKLKLNNLATKYLLELPPLTASQKKESQIPKYLKAIAKGGGGNVPSGVQFGVERPIGQILRLLEKVNVVDFQVLWLLDGLGTLGSVVEKSMQPNSDVSKLAVTKAIQLYRNSCSNCPHLARHALLSSGILVLLDALMYTLDNPENEKTPSCPVDVSTELLLALSVIFSQLSKQKHPQVSQRLPDIISYIVSSGIIESITRRCLEVREPIEHKQQLILPFLASLGFLTKIIQLSELCPKDEVDVKFLSLIKTTELFGTISLLYSTVVPNGECVPPRTISLAAATYNLLKAIAFLDVETFQNVLSEEKITFMFLDVVTTLLNYCDQKQSDKSESKAVIVDVIILLGYLCCNNKRNQILLTLEQWYVVLKSITKLPKEYEPFIYPTLVAVVWENPEAENILRKDFDIELLMEFKNSEYAKKNKLVSMLEL